MQCLDGSDSAGPSDGSVCPNWSFDVGACPGKGLRMSVLNTFWAV